MKGPDQFEPLSSYEYFFYPLQTHRSWEVAIQIDGESVIEYRTKRYNLAHKQIFIIAPNAPHRLGLKLYSKGPSRILWILATSDTIFPFLSTYQEGRREKEWAIEITAPGAFLLHEIQNEIKLSSADHDDAIALFLASFLMLVARKLQFKENLWKNANKTAIVMKVKNYINENPGRQISLDELSSFVSVSKNYLSTVFKNTTGDTISQYIQEARSHQAIQYLVKTDKKLSEIAEIVGFCDQFHFSKVFKEIMGIPPAEYRRTYGKKLSTENDND